MNGLTRAWMVLSIALLTGCATATIKKLESPLAQEEKASAVVIYLEQSEVAVDDVDVQNGGGGVLGVLIEGIMESTMTSNRQKAVAPLRDALLDLDYENQLVEAIRLHLPEALVQSDASVKIVRNDAEWRAHLQTVVPANVLVIGTRYGFEQNFEIAYVYASADLSHHHRVPPTAEANRRMSRDKRKAAEPTPLHRGVYYSQHATRDLFAKLVKIKGLAGYETDAAAWAENAAEPARNAFSVALPEVAQLIQADAERQLSTPADPSKVRILAANAFWQPAQVNADLLDQTQQRALVKWGQSYMWIDQRQIKRERR